MFKLRYKLCSPIRVLLPLSGVLFATPYVITETYDVVWFPILYFLASYCVFLNFPCMVEMLHKKPLYFEDLIIIRKNISDNTFQNLYTIIMSFVYAVLFGILSDYVLLEQIHTKSVADIVGTIGANILVFIKVQNELGKQLVTVCNIAKNNSSIRNVFEGCGDNIQRVEESKSTTLLVNSSPTLSPSMSPTLLSHIRSKSCSNMSDLDHRNLERL